MIMAFNYLHSAIVLLAYCYLTRAQINLQPANIDPKVYESVSGRVCTDAPLCSQIKNGVQQLLNSSILPQLYGVQRNIPASSCADIYQGHPSGYYWLNVTNEPQLVYCTLNANHCCGESDGMWMRIVYLNMSDPSAQCPDGWRENNTTICTCRKQNNTNINTVNYTSYGIPYSRVCGRIIAYQLGTPEGFLGYINQNQQTLNAAYVDGISITFGHPRNHVWTFAATRVRQPNTCPCNNISGNTLPYFVNGDYFCEVGIRNTEGNLLDDNSLWDGQSCANSDACCEFNNPPWFCKQLNQTTTEDIEIRIMGNVVGNHNAQIVHQCN